LRLQVAARATDFGSVGIDFGCKSAVAITDGETHSFVKAPKFLRKAEAQIKHLSKGKRRKVAPNRRKKQKASSRWKNTQVKISKVTRKVANQRFNWVHQVASDIVRCNSCALNAPRFANVATEKLEVSKMTRKAKKGKRKKQKAGLNKSILDVGMGMLRTAIEYKLIEACGVFVEVPTKTVKPSQTCPNCGLQHKKTLDERIHQCEVCGFTMNRDLAAALVMLLWAQGKLPGFGTSFVDADVSSSTSYTSKLSSSWKHEATRANEAPKTRTYWAGRRNPPFNEVRAGSSSASNDFSYAVPSASYADSGWQQRYGRWDNRQSESPDIAALVPAALIRCNRPSEYNQPDRCQLLLESPLPSRHLAELHAIAHNPAQCKMYSEQHGHNAYSQYR
jgi:hypothetical protein